MAAIARVIARLHLIFLLDIGTSVLKYSVQKIKVIIGVLGQINRKVE